MKFTLHCPHCLTKTPFTLEQDELPQRPKDDVAKMVEAWVATLSPEDIRNPRPAPEWLTTFNIWRATHHPDTPEVPQRKFSTAVINLGATYQRVTGGARVYTMPVIGAGTDQLTRDVAMVEQWFASLDLSTLVDYRTTRDDTFREDWLVSTFRGATKQDIPTDRLIQAFRASKWFEFRTTTSRGNFYRYTRVPDRDTTKDGQADTTVDDDTGTEFEALPDGSSVFRGNEGVEDYENDDRFAVIDDPTMMDSADGVESDGVPLKMTFKELLGRELTDFKDVEDVKVTHHPDFPELPDYRG